GAERGVSRWAIQRHGRDAGEAVPEVRGRGVAPVPATKRAEREAAVFACEGGMIEVGDYDLRGRDVETALVGPVTATIIDADRRVREEWSNGFPNWAMYRAAYCGDSLYRPQVRAWCVAYAIAYCEAGGV